MRVLVLFLGLWPMVSAAGPELLVHEPLHDFGLLYAEDHPKVEHRFTVQNVGDENLVIHHVSASCGCTKADVGKKELAPGETTELVAELEFRKRFGKEQIRVTLGTNDPEHPAFDVGLSGHLVRHWEIEPGIMPEVVLAGTSVVTRPIRLVTHRLPGFEPWKIVEVESRHPAVEATLESETTTPNPAGFDQTEWIYQATVHAASSPTLEEQASIAFKTDDPSYGPLVTTLKWKVEKDLTVRPTALELIRSRYRDRDHSESHIVTVKSKSGEPFRVLGVTPPEGFRAEWSEGPAAATHEIPIRIVGTGDGAWSGEGVLEIATDRPGEKRLSMKLRGQAEALGPIFFAESTIHRMGTGYQGDWGEVSHEFSFSNRGTRSLLLSAPVLEGVTAELSAAEIEPGSSAWVRVTADFTGREGLIDLGAVYPTNDETQPEAAFRLQGMVAPRWKFDPPRVEWKNVQPGTELKRAVRAIQYIDSWEQPAKVGPGPVEAGSVRVEVGETRVVHGAVGVSTAETPLVVTLRPGAEAGRRTESADLFEALEGRPAPPSLEVEWNVLGRLRSRPSSLVFRSADQPESFSLRVYSQDKTPFLIESVEAPPGIEITPKTTAPGEAVYEVKRTGAFRGEGDVVFHTSLAEEPEFSVSVSVRGGSGS